VTLSSFPLIRKPERLDDCTFRQLLIGISTDEHAARGSQGLETCARVDRVADRWVRNMAFASDLSRTTSPLLTPTRMRGQPDAVRQLAQPALERESGTCGAQSVVRLIARLLKRATMPSPMNFSTSPPN
jgi:hypothetical protein